MIEQARQGDVWMERVDRIPEKAKKQNSGPVILAHGEVTGHSHRVLNWEDVTSYVDENGDIFISSTKDIEVVHDEHGPITLPPGEYCVTRQREYDAFAERKERQVLD